MDMACVLVGRMRSWCVNLLESGPFWAREQAMLVIESCDEFSVRLQENSERCPDPFNSLGKFWLRVVALCLNLGRRAPPGWHFRLMRENRDYREMFKAPGVRAVRPS